MHFSSACDHCMGGHEVVTCQPLCFQLLWWDSQEFWARLQCYEQCCPWWCDCTEWPKKSVLSKGKENLWFSLVRTKVLKIINVQKSFSFYLITRMWFIIGSFPLHEDLKKKFHVLERVGRALIVSDVPIAGPLNSGSTGCPHIALYSEPPLDAFARETIGEPRASWTQGTFPRRQ